MRTSDSIDNGPSSNAQDYIRHSSLLTDDERQAGRNTPVIIQLEERLPDPLTVEDAQDRIRITGWAYEQEPTPGSSSGASRKRGSDQIDDDGVGASSASASRPKRPRRNNAKGLKPSASSSRTGTTAGASDLPTNK
ncbi:uncharacterized protein STEHIDRAFT_125882 [Stereum hirsutum FP-91666 SS1]|uniref:Uncharacterized protein n=1 Tax=Stereum hirsutum (strain FP-91666) TaxID=721885 RepID=R7RY94_STEHR|nr:uncharacterized protein STEHIDRAFT_125882 [Stereum hirsutum FP-91666 SS1]EIM80304.1 hypothetical protein STEHIDRAFT_125882 [Stereum hirsutum FP-91666 SS1]